MVERFFSTNQRYPLDVKDDQFILLSGPPSCGKTSLLFQFAINFVQDCETGSVVFICNRRRLESNPPCLSQGIDPSSDVFQRIQMKYLEDDEGIKKYFAAFHLHEAFPLAIIIDDFGDFFQEKTCQEKFGNARGRDLAMVRVLALCQDALNHANEKCPTQRPMMLLLSDTHHGETPRFLFIYKRWIRYIFTVKGLIPVRTGVYFVAYLGSQKLNDEGLVDAKCFESSELQDNVGDQLSLLYNEKCESTHNFCLSSGSCQNRSVFSRLPGFPKAQDDKGVDGAEGYESPVLQDNVGDQLWALHKKKRECTNNGCLNSGSCQSRGSAFPHLSRVPKSQSQIVVFSSSDLGETMDQKAK